jgi:hypothetical protein
MISDSYWNHLTLVGQAYGSLVCCWEALLGRAGLVPDVFIGSSFCWSLLLEAQSLMILPVCCDRYDGLRVYFPVRHSFGEGEDACRGLRALPDYQVSSSLHPLLIFPEWFSELKRRSCFVSSQHRYAGSSANA